MFCSHCGKEIANDAKFCSFCGGAVNSPATTQGTAKENVALPPLPQTTLYNIKSCKGNGKAATIIKKIRPELSIFYISKILNTPQSNLLTNLTKEKAEAIKKELETAGAKVVITPANSQEHTECLHVQTTDKPTKSGRAKIGCAVLTLLLFVGLINSVVSVVKESINKTNKTLTPATQSQTTEKKPDVQKQTTVPEKEPDTQTQTTVPEKEPDTQTQTTIPEKKPDGKTQTKVAEKKPTTKAPHKAPISDGAIYTYPETEKKLKKAGFPKLLKKLGLKNIKKANQLMPKAAEKVALNPKCDAVVHVDISDRSERNKLIIYADAKNGQRFYLTENEILSSKPAISEQEQLAPLLWRHELMAEEVIKSKLTHPSTYDRHELGIWQSVTTANCNQIMVEFSAKNSFGVELTYIAVVQFDKNSNVVGFHMQEKR